MGFGTSLVKWLLFVFNLIFFLIGLAVVVIGIVFIVAIKNFTGGTSFSFYVPAILFLVIGLVIAVVAFFGCFGAVRESSCLIKTFVVMMVIVLLVTIAFLIVSLVMRGKVGTWVSGFILDLIGGYATPQNQVVVDHIQNNFTCCGAVDYHDWEIYYNAKKVPDSCCIPGGTTCVTTYTDVTGPVGTFDVGCGTKFGDWLNSKVVIVAVIFGVVIAIQIVGMIFGCVVVHQWDYKYEPI